MVSSLIDTLPLTKAESDGDLDFCFLDLALALAAKGDGQVKPNPLVGSVIVKDGSLWARAFTGTIESSTPKYWHSNKQAGLRKAQLSMSIWNHVATEGMANGLLRAQTP